jgi:hypothetical protein
METKNLLKKEIEFQFGELHGMEVGSESHKATIDGLTKLMDREIEIEKLASENRVKAEQMKEEKKDRLIRNVLAGAGIVIPSVITVWGTLKSLKFEEDGSITTTIGRGFINKLLPKK